MASCVRRAARKLSVWHIITGEYPPKIGGVGDYTRHVAGGLAAAGEQINIWTPRFVGSDTRDPGVVVHALPDHFGPLALAALDRALGNAPNEQVLIQYVPQAYGFKGMNLMFCLWLNARRKRSLFVNFHEVMFALESGRPLPDNLLGTVTALMAILMAHAANHIFVSATVLERILRSRLGVKKAITCLPVPSNIPVVVDPHRIHSIRLRYATGGGLIGHFSTFAPDTKLVLQALLPAILADNPTVAVLLLGSGSLKFRDLFLSDHPQFAPRLFATGALAPSFLSCAISACDLMLQPYSDGVSTRRSTLMAALEHGRPVVSNRGIATEKFWDETGSLALAPAGDINAMRALTRELLSEDSVRARLAANAHELYAREFDLRHTISTLRAAA